MSSFLRTFTLLCLAWMLPLGAQAVDWSKKLPHQHQSRFFHFHHQRAGWDVKAFARFADGFVDLVSRDFVPVRFDYPITVLVLPDKAAFQQFLRKELAVSNPPNFGIYFRAFKVFATFEDSGIGTFAHEIMHPLVDRNLADAPMWATEAIPAFFEKGFGYWDDQRLVMRWGYQNPWRIDAIGDQLTKLDLRRILSDRLPVTKLNNSERRLVTVFLWQHGKLERFMRAIASRKRTGYESYFEAAFDKPLRDILPLWQAYLQEIAANHAQALNIPPTTVFENAATFDAAFAQRTPWPNQGRSSGADGKTLDLRPPYHQLFALKKNPLLK